MKDTRPAIQNLTDEYINMLQYSKNTPEFEIGIRFNVNSSQASGMKYIYSQMIDNYKQNSTSIEIIEHLDIYYSNDIRKTMVFVKGVNQKKDIIQKKTIVGRPFIISRSIKNVKDIKAKLSNEELVSANSISGNIRFMKFKLRLRFNYDNENLHGVELDLIKNVNPEADLKNIKSAVFKDYSVDSILNGIEFSLFDECRLEFEFDNNKVKKHINSGSELSVDYLFKPINELSEKSGTGSSAELELYQKYIFSLARQIIYNNKGYLETFRYKSGLKKLLNNVIEMDANVYFKDIQPKITNGNGFYITDKIDGKRSVLMIKYEEESESNCNIVLLNNNITFFHKMKVKKDMKIQYITLDCEMLVEGNGKISLFVFDVITFKSQKFSSKPFEERLSIMEEAVIKSKEILEVCGVNNLEITKKNFILTRTDTWKEQIQQFYKDSLNKKYEIDGLIFTPKDDSNYSSMLGYKWKPAEHSTIDFYAKKIPSEVLKTSAEFFLSNYSKKDIKKYIENKEFYVLFSGISKKDLDAFNLKFIPHYESIVGKLPEGNLKPVQFSTSDRPNNFIFEHTNSSIDLDLDGKIGEFGWNYKKEAWELKRIRTDRDVELARGEYFGNYYKVAENIWYSINNPLTFEDLLKDGDSSMYFMADNVDIYKEQRNYNSFVKTVCIQTVLEHVSKNPLVLDLASGKGQDLARLAKLGVSDAIFVDNDKSALQELIRRKHSLSSNSSRGKNMKVTTCHADLNLEYKEIIKSIESSYGEKLKDSVDMIICNFAMHYIANGSDKLKNIINLLSYFLKPKGLFVFTCFDGDKVKRLCSDNGWNSYTDKDIQSTVNNKLKYSIIPIENSERVKLILPFSNGNYYEEDLLNLSTIEDYMTSNGFVKESVGSFSNLFEKYKNLDNLSEDDKVFSGLYSYNIYRKDNSSASNIIVKKISPGSILYVLPADIMEKTGSYEMERDSLLNLPMCNNIVIISDYKEKLSNIMLSDISKCLESFGFRDYRNNSRVRKYVYIIGDAKDKLVEKFINQKGKRSGSISIIIMSKDFTEFSNYAQYLLKIPSNTINVKNICTVMSKEEYEKNKNIDMLESSSFVGCLRLN